MKLKEMRIKNFSGVKNVRLCFGEKGFVPIEEGESKPGSNSGTEGREDIIHDALTWVLFGTSHSGHNVFRHSDAYPSEVELDFDNYSIHRRQLKDIDEMSVRFFEYSTYTFCCAQTVKELSTGATPDVQRMIESRIGFSDPSFIGNLLEN